MRDASWEPLPEAPEVIENNWLFRLERAPYRSRASGRTHAFYRMALAQAVVVVALTPRDEVVLVRQFRVGSERDGLEPPGGLVDEGEDVCAAAERELLEETGHAGDTPRVLGTNWANPSIMTQRITTVLITNVERVAEPVPDENEELRVELAPARTIPAMIVDGRIHHALAVQGLLMWLVSQLPGSPWSVGAPAKRGRWQFHIQTLLLAVLVSAAAFAAMRLLGRGGSVVAAGVVASVAPIWLLKELDWREGAILLKPGYLTPRALGARVLAAFGLWALGFVAASAVIVLARSLRII